MDSGFLYDQASLILEMWQQEMVREGKNLTMVVRNRLGLPVGRVPLNCNYEVQGIHYAPLIKALYEREFDEDKVLAAWDAAVAAMMEGKPNLPFIVPKELGVVLPCFDFTKDQHPYYPCAQFLKVLSFNDEYKMTLNPVTCLVETPSGKKIGIDRTALFDSKKGYRTRRRIDDLRSPMNMWRGRNTVRPANARAYGAYHHLQKNLPHYTYEIDALFSIVIEAGREVENALHEKLDSYYEQTYREPKYGFRGNAIATATELINNARGNPLAALADILVPVCGSKKFIELFGNYGQKHRKEYTPEMRQRYLAGIEKVKASESRDVEVKKEEATYDLLSTMFGI